MWQVKIPFNHEEEKEKIILSSFLNNSKGIEELGNELIIFFDTQDDMEGFKSTISDKKVFVEKISEKINWLSKWKRFHKVIKIPPFFIVPFFKKGLRIPKSFKRIVINPSFAFGTGSHPTTKMCIKFLVDVVKQGDRVLDLGCGSGILAICAEKLGASYVLAVDIDEIALKEAEKNILRNRCKRITLSNTINDKEKFDIVVCNILLNTILELKPKIESLLKSGGRLILSGILKDQTYDVKKAFSYNFRLIKVRTLKDNNYNWVSFLYEKI